LLIPAELRDNPASLERSMATGWAAEGAVQDQIDATVKDAISRAQRQLPQGPGLAQCAECGCEIPEARRTAVPGARLCLACQDAHDHDVARFSGYNRRGSKDSQLR
jgi:phage/conjugal plasmid C-4 type zinc finger TraR family protein